MLLRQQLLNILLSLPNLSLTKDRQAFVSFLGLPDSITSQLEWEGTTLAFANHLIQVLIGIGRTELVEFVNKLASAESLVGLETRQKCAELSVKIAELSEEEGRSAFGWPAPSTSLPAFVVPLAAREPAPRPANPLSVLRQRLVERYDLEELKTLCADLSVDYDSLGGEGKTAKARELVAYMQRRGRLAELEQLLIM